MTLRLSDFEEENDVSREDYDEQLEALHHQLELIQAAYINQGHKAIIAVEGWDAAGKGGLIKRVVAPLDPRFTKTWSIGAPTAEQLDHHYLWRFWQRLPASREIAIYDRSWYGRVLVERVDNLTPEPDWKRAYEEINQFEALLIAGGTRIVKLFLHISQEEQDKRLQERLKTPWKRWKTGLDDYHNRSQREAYMEAYHDMFDFCSTAIAPWTIIPANDKKSARLQGLETIIQTLSQDVSLTYPEVPEAVLAAAKAALGDRASD